MARTLDFVVGPEVKTQNAPYVLARCIANRERGDQAWRFVREHWDHANAAFPNPSIVRMIEPVKTLTRPDQQADVAAFFAEHDIPQAAKTLQQVLERQRVNVALRAREVAAPGVPLRRVSGRRADPSLEVFAVEPTTVQLIVRSHVRPSMEVSAGDLGPTVDAARRDRRRRAGRACGPATSYRLALDGSAGRGGARRWRHPRAGTSVASPPCPTSTSARRASARARACASLRIRPRPTRSSACGPRWRSCRRGERRASIVKGDVAHDCRAREYDLAGAAPGRAAHPDVQSSRATTTAGTIATTTRPRPWPATASRSPWTRPGCARGGLDVVLANTVHPGHEHGYAPAADDVLFELVREARSGHGRPPPPADDHPAPVLPASGGDRSGRRTLPRPARPGQPGHARDDRPHPPPPSPIRTVPSWSPRWAR